MRSLGSRLLFWAVVGCFAASDGLGGSVRAAEVRELVKQIREVGPQGTGHASVVKAQRELIQVATPDQLLVILAGMDSASPLATNWLRGAFEAVADRSLKSKSTLPQRELEAFLKDAKHAPQPRRLAYEWLDRVDPSVQGRLLGGMLDDPSMELRREAVAMELKKCDELAKRNDKAATRAAYRKVLSSARDLDQVKDIAKQLDGLGEKVDLAEHFGFVQTWHLIGPFDNRNKIGFETAYPPETEIKLDASLKGKEESVAWKAHTTEDEMGVVDLNKAIGKHMGAVAYAYAAFDSPTERPIELRLGCIVANKIWLNGELVTANHVYHANDAVDQYVGRGKLKAGKNAILLKICQNEQTEAWAQDWKFQLRVCDAVGTAVLSTDRKRVARVTETREEK